MPQPSARQSQARLFYSFVILPENKNDPEQFGTDYFAPIKERPSSGLSLSAKRNSKMNCFTQRSAERPSRQAARCRSTAFALRPTPDLKPHSFRSRHPISIESITAFKMSVAMTGV